MTKDTKVTDDTVVTVKMLRQLQEPTREYCYGKIHRCTVTEANLNYTGSITVDSALLRASGILPHTKVEVVNITRKDAARIMTYVVEGPENSGVICLNGAAAHHFNPGDLAIIMAYETVPLSQIPHRQHRVVHVKGANNQIDNVRIHTTPSLDELGQPENNRYGEAYETSGAEVISLKR